MEVKGIFVTKINKVEAYKCFDDISEKYGSRTALMSGNNQQQAALMKAYCHDLNKAIDTMFFSEMYGASRCKRRITALGNKPVDGVQLQSTVSEIFGIILDLRAIVNDSIPLSELPSCKSLTDLSVEDAISASKDLVKSNIVKTVIGALLTFVNAGKIIGVIEVRNYYKDQIKELEYELSQDNRKPTDIEVFLMDKYHSEIGYCNLAGLKVGLSGFNEIRDLESNAQKAIMQFNERANTPMTIKQ